jgi:hypothetical protein
LAPGRRFGIPDGVPQYLSVNPIWGHPQAAVKSTQSIATTNLQMQDQFSLKRKQKPRGCPQQNLHAKNFGARGLPNRMPLANKELAFVLGLPLAKKEFELYCFDFSGVKISPKKSFISLHERSAASGLYATPLLLSSPAAGFVKACTAFP